MADQSPVSHITDDMRAAAIKAVWDDATISRLAVQGAGIGYAVSDIVDIVLETVEAALAGCTVVPVREQTGKTVDGELYWHTALSSITAGLNLADRPFIRINGEFVDAVHAEADALAQLAAVRHARSLAGGSQVGDQHV